MIEIIPPVQRFVLEGREFRRFVVWVFKEIGDEFPPHAHEEGDTHISFPLFGRLRMTGDPKFAGRIIEPMRGGLIIGPFEAGVMHGFVAETAGASIGHAFLK